MLETTTNVLHHTEIVLLLDMQQLQTWCVVIPTYLAKKLNC